MEEVLIRGVATRTWKNAAPSLRAVLEQSLVHRRLAFRVYEDESLMFEQHFAAAATMAHRLAADFGVQKGDRVAIAMRNFPEWSIAFWAAASLGAVVVPLNAWWTGPELEYGLSDSGSVVVFVDDERNERLAEHLSALPALRGVIVARAEHELAAPAQRFEDVLGVVQVNAALPSVDLDPEDDATIFYTSGTTGRPKGALGTQRNICTNLMSLVFCAARGAARSDAPPAEIGRAHV